MKKTHKYIGLQSGGIAIACFALYMINIYFIATVPSMYMAVICDDLGLDRATFSLFSMIRSGGSFLLGLFMSRIVIRLHIKPVVALGVISSAISMLLMSASRDLWSFYAAGVIGVFGFTALNGATLTIIIRQSFAKGQNTLYGIVCASSGIMGVFFNPLLSKLIDRTSWQNGFLMVGFLIIGIGTLAFVLLAFFFREKAMTIEQQTVAYTKTKNTADERFHLILVCTLAVISGLCGGVLFVNVAPIMMSFGFSALFATGLIASVAAFTNCGSKILMGRLFDKFSPKCLFIVWDLVLIIGLVLCIVLENNQSQMIAIIATACMGAGPGIGVIGVPVWGTSCFSPRKQSEAIYLATAMATIGSAVGSTLFQMGYHEATNSYEASLIMELCLAVLFAVLTCVLYGNVKKVSHTMVSGIAVPCQITEE